MPRFIAALVTGALAAGLLVLPPALPALADSAFSEILKDYEKDGKIDPCAHSDKTLRAAQGNVPNDIEQYAPDFPDALAAALRARAAGACEKRQAAAGGAAAGAGGAGAGSSPARPGGAAAGPGAPPAPPPVAPPAGGELASSIPVAASASTAGPPAPIVLLAIVGGLLLAAAALTLASRALGWEPRALGPFRHAWREAGWRAAGGLSELADWARLGH